MNVTKRETVDAALRSIRRDRMRAWSWIAVISAAIVTAIAVWTS